MPQPKQTKIATASPQRFFTKQLSGEEPPSLETMGALYALAQDLYARSPWNVLADSELIAIEQPGSRELGFCSVMGALGEVFSVQLYLGPSSYNLFRKIRDGEPLTAGAFFASQRSVLVDYVQARELTPPDREMLDALGHARKRGARAPIFRAIRPGYHHWYVTESEATLLAHCIRAVAAMCDQIQAIPEQPYWEQKDVYPLMLPQADGTYTIRLVEAPSAVQTIPQPPALDQDRIAAIRSRHFPSAGIIQVDHFYGAAMVGGPNERKACMRLAMAVDAKTGLSYPPETASPEDSTGELLQNLVLAAIQVRRALPVEIQVRDVEFKALLDQLAGALGVRLKVARSLPALDFAKDSILAMMGDPGTLRAF